MEKARFQSLPGCRFTLIELLIVIAIIGGRGPLPGNEAFVAALPLFF